MTQDQIISAITSLQQRENELLFELDEVRDAIRMMENELEGKNDKGN